MPYTASLKDLFLSQDLVGIRRVLEANPSVANEEYAYDESNTARAHPLNRICDGVFTGRFTDEQAVRMAKILLAFGARVNGNEPKEKYDSPLVAAASLHADQLAILYIEHGADIHHAGCHGGTALHWAAWCGRPVLVERLIREGSQINRRCIDFSSTALFWAAHGLLNNDHPVLADYKQCINLLVAAGADKTIPNAEGKTISDILRTPYPELEQSLNQS